jgi:phosphopantothenoylcysteine decarboxylase/phosphopantothenate--cysteine ligase
MGNDLLSTVILATNAPVAVAPAMNQQMYSNIATQENISTLKKRGFHIWGPAAGEQACGDIGYGRMLEPMQLVKECESFFAEQESTTLSLKDKSVLITAGPTREAIDPVRFISNHSSGKMGYALAEAASKLGAKVTLISGPVSLPTPERVEKISVESAMDMYKHVMKNASSNDVFIACAAVADYRPNSVADQKIKKTDDSDEMSITMVKNPDIVASVASIEANRPFTVGFAAETQDVEKYARGKLEKKNLDLICANDVSVEGQGFNANDNALTLYWKQGESQLPLESKQALALKIMQKIEQLMD